MFFVLFCFFFFFIIVFVVVNFVFVYQVKIDPLINAAKTIAYGPGLEDGKNKDGEPTSFIIETRDKDGKPVGALGKGLPFVVDVQGPKGKVPHKIKDLGDGRYEVKEKKRRKLPCF